MRVERRCCRTLTADDSQRESMRLDGSHEQAASHPLPHDELVQLQRGAAQARLDADLGRPGDGLAGAASRPPGTPGGLLGCRHPVLPLGQGAVQAAIATDRWHGGQPAPAGGAGLVRS